MRRGLLVGILALLGAMALASTASARSQHYTFPIEDEFVAEGLSDVCGFEVRGSVQGTVRVTLILDREGNVVREVDTFTGTFTFSSDNGSFSFPLAQPAIFDYGEGAELGGTATVTLVGLAGHVPGFIPSDAGRLVFQGTIVGFDENIPIVEDFELLDQRGNFQEGEEIDAAICAALS